MLIQLLAGTVLLLVSNLALAHVVASRVTNTIKALVDQAAGPGGGEKIPPTAMNFQKTDQLSDLKAGRSTS